MFVLPDLPYPYNSLEPHLDEETMRIHHDKHHAGYVEKLNKALEGNDEFLNIEVGELLKSLHGVPEEIRETVKNNAGGHANHSLFWQIMTPEKKELSGKLKEAIEKTFSSSFQEKFMNAAMGVFGSGWAWLTKDKEGKLELVTTPNQDSPLSFDLSPILGVDVWEHAYYLKYQNKRADYLQAWWNVVDWEEVEKRFLT